MSKDVFLCGFEKLNKKQKKEFLRYYKSLNEDKDRFLDNLERANMSNNENLKPCPFCLGPAINQKSLAKGVRCKNLNCFGATRCQTKEDWDGALCWKELENKETEMRWANSSYMSMKENERKMEGKLRKALEILDSCVVQTGKRTTIIKSELGEEEDAYLIPKWEVDDFLFRNKNFIKLKSQEK